MRKSKYEGIDEREIKCCDDAPNTIEAGICFDELEDGTNVLRFHFLEYIHFGTEPKLNQKTKSMYLNKENTEQLIKALKNLKLK